MSRWRLQIGFDEEIRRLPKWQINALMVATVLSVAYADHGLGPELGFSIFYLLPIIVATRNMGKRTGFMLALVCTVLGVLMDHVHGVIYSKPSALYWHTILRFILFTITVMIFDGWEKEKDNARTDSLTLAANRLAFEEFGRLEIKRCRRYEHPFSIIYIDVDDFKIINDHFGHRAGDRALVVLANALRKSFRETDLIARLGGDEFSVILVETDAKGARTALDRVGEVLAQMPHKGGPITLSIGLLTFTKAPETFEEAVKKADELMYLAKNKGKNCIEAKVI
jgi:diguanylate cyclase (GGDEF)-like protein